MRPGAPATTSRVFAYGTLALPAVMQALAGRRLASRAATLADFARRRLRDRAYPGVVPAEGERTEGRLYEDVDEATLAQLDRFEGELYERRRLEVEAAGGARLLAEVYVVAPRHRGLVEGEPWDADAFAARHLAAYLAECEAFRAAEEAGAAPAPVGRPALDASRGGGERALRRERIRVGAGAVSALLSVPAGARALLALAHGAGAGMEHPFLAALSGVLAARGVATLRYQFPYMEAGSRRPDPRPALLATVRAAVAAAAELAPGLPLLAGGKSMGGRMTSLAAAEAPLASVRGLVLVGFPLHPARRPATERAAHLSHVPLPMLFLQGTRDDLADLARLRPICEALGARATLHVVEGADHSFRVRRRDGRSEGDVLCELAGAVCAFAERVSAAP